MKIFINETTKDVLDGIYHVNFLIYPLIWIFHNEAQKKLNKNYP